MTVAGFATLSENGYAYLTNNNGVIYYGGSTSGFVSSAPVYIGGSVSISPLGGYRGNNLIVDWNNTLTKLWKNTLDSSTVSITFSVTVNRQDLISPWNIQSSVTNVNKISDTIQNQVMANYLVNGNVNNMLVIALANYQNSFNDMLTNFVIVSIPVFFVAWYLGSTVSDVSFNIRRREIGLLSTKGLSSGQIQRMFLTEAVVLGAIGGALGIVGGLILNQYYIGTVNLTNLFATQTFSPTIGLVTIVFGIILALTSVFWSSRKASRIPAVNALRDYLPMENKSRFWSILHWIALILGGYKIVAFALGLNVSQLIYQATSYSSGGFFLSAIASPLVQFDNLMTLLGPLLFLWGLSNILIRDSDKFQRAASKISSVMGELGALAAKNVRRNPARLAAIGFLIAFILAFSVQVTGQVASQQDFIVRNVHQSVGADVAVTIDNASRAQAILNNVLGNVTCVSNATIQRTLNAQLSDSYSPMQIRTINPDTFAASAYYEPGWFTGASIPQMMADLKNNNNTIILDRSVAKQLGLNLYDEVGIHFNSVARKLRIVGFFGPEPSDSSLPQQIYNGISTKYVNPMFYSYVPANLFNMSESSDVYTVESFQTTYLIKLDAGVNGTLVANQIRNVDPTEIVSVDSFDQEWQLTTSYNNVGTYTNQQTLDIQGLGLVFAVLSASVGTALVAMVSLKERSREATLMSVRGLSYRQLVWMFLTESMAIVTFSMIIGVVVGIIIAYGRDRKSVV